MGRAVGPLIAAVEERRVRLNRTQRAQARALGMHEALYSKLLKGERQPTLQVIFAAIHEHPPLLRLVRQQVQFQAACAQVRQVRGPTPEGH